MKGHKKMTTIYKILVKTTGKVEKFSTNLNEIEFYKTLDGVYGTGNYSTLEIDYVLD